MGYDPAFPRVHYDGVADKEWTRLTRNRRGELNFLVHMDVLRRHITADMDVLEIGAGAGIYTKELLHMARRLVVSDLSEVQLALNQDHMRELGVLNQVDEYRILDLADLGALDAASFDAVVCVGGPLSYLLDKESEGLRQMLRVVKAGGIVVLGVMSLINTLVLFMGMLPAEKQANGIDNLR
ncbi:MAG: class I SAM-dependent methyltransferase, partial [Gammaproteobacteria bacterium]|nr:class I SAM-dependent methyltransferase [Gammaproteobacteria bacterium]